MVSSRSFSVLFAINPTTTDRERLGIWNGIQVLGIYCGERRIGALDPTISRNIDIDSKRNLFLEEVKSDRRKNSTRLGVDGKIGKTANPSSSNLYFHYLHYVPNWKFAIKINVT